MTGLTSNADVLAYVEVEFEYNDGLWQPCSLNVTPADNLKLIKLKEGEEYDHKEFALNSIMGVWTSIEYGITYELTISESLWFLSEGYATEVFDSADFKVASYDAESKKVKLETDGVLDSIQIIDDSRIQVISKYGTGGEWTRK